jgi:hypothetical protein
MTDIPAAAGVAAVSAVALRRGSKASQTFVFTLALLAVLIKPSSVVPAIAGLLIAVLIVEKPWSWRAVCRSRSLALAAGVAVALLYDQVMAYRLHQDLLAYLRSGTTGYYASLADARRGDTLLRLDLLGPELALPLAFALMYGVGRALKLSHRAAAWLALVAATIYTAVGPFAAGVPNGPFHTPESAFAFTGFATLLAFVPFAPHAFHPSRLRVVQLLLIALPPSFVWASFGIYEHRLEAPAWPPLAALIAICLACAVRSLHRIAGVAALAPLPVLAVAMWASVVSIDGFHGPMWREYRSLGLSGMWDRDRTSNIVMPAISETVEALRAEIGSNGRVYASDPHFQFWFPTTIGYPTKCSDLRGLNGFVLSTSDESQTAMRQAGGSPNPSWWADCKNPRLRQLSDGSNGLAAFVVL